VILPRAGSDWRAIQLARYTSREGLAGAAGPRHVLTENGCATPTPEADGGRGITAAARRGSKERGGASARAAAMATSQRPFSPFLGSRQERPLRAVAGRQPRLRRLGGQPGGRPLCRAIAVAVGRDCRRRVSEMVPFAPILVLIGADDVIVATTLCKSPIR